MKWLLIINFLGSVSTQLLPDAETCRTVSRELHRHFWSGDPELPAHDNLWTECVELRKQK